MNCTRDGWESCQCEEEAEELFLEVEEGDEVNWDAMSKAQDEVKKAGMLPYSEPEWREKLEETLINACADKSTKLYMDRILEEVEKAAKATCMVLRRNASGGRNSGNGTGFLFFPKSRFGWLVITNNHVIMNEEEAKTAEVIFDYNVDGNKAKITKFCVSHLVSKDLRTENNQDLSKLDFSVLALKCDKKDGDRFLKEHATMLIDESDRVNDASMEAVLELECLAFRPMIAFSHARGLAKRVSIGEYPNKCHQRPVAHIKHTLPTALGSSGANLIYPPSSTSTSRFQDWNSAFLHYRHGNAVALQAIFPKIRKDFCSN